MLLLPKGTPLGRESLRRACRCLHLAFKGYEPEKIYNVLAACLLLAIASHDPEYAEKVRKMVRVLGTCMAHMEQFSAWQVDKHLELKSQYIVRKPSEFGAAARPGSDAVEYTDAHANLMLLLGVRIQ